MATTYLHFFTVEGTNVFPVDMLRYDSCWPVTSEDAVQIGSAIRRDHFGTNPRRSIRLMTENHEPTTKRWASFGWTVTNYEKMKRS